jgi:hypothetical protein
MFGLGGQYRADAAIPSADAEFTWVFTASSGDSWTGRLFDIATQYAPGDSVTTPFGEYRILSEAEFPLSAGMPSGIVRIEGHYVDNLSASPLTIQGAAAGTLEHGYQGLGSEMGLAWDGAAWQPFGAGGGVQVNATPYPPIFQSQPLATGAFGTEPEAGGWASQNRFPRSLADVNGDGRADIVGFGGAGAWVALARGDGSFGGMQLGAAAFGTEPEAGGWASQDRFPRSLADVNGDGRADIVGFGGAGVWVALARGDGSFGGMQLAVAGFGTEPQAGGWASQDRFPRSLADVNGDGRADIIGFGVAGAWVALARSDGSFSGMQLGLAAFGTDAVAGGWANQDRFPRSLADVNGDGRADIVGFGGAGAWSALADDGIL